MNKRTKVTAIYQGTLIEYDGPQLAHFITSRDYPLVAVAVNRDDMEYAMFGVELNDPVFDRYMAGKADLASLFWEANKARLYFLDFADCKQGMYRLYSADADEITDASYYPLRGIFSRAHNFPINATTDAGMMNEKFLIDGQWDARDFARFSNRIADLYSLVRVADKLVQDVDAEDKDLLVKLIEERNWQGGGSYGGFYGATKAHTVRDYPLNVVGIEYHSPGYIEMRGYANTLNHVIYSVKIFNEQRDFLRERYRTLYKLMRHEGLLTAEKNSEFASEATQAYAVRLAIEFGDAMQFPVVKSIKEAIGATPLFIKVVLSYYRRLSDLHQFYVEGRVKFGF